MRDLRTGTCSASPTSKQQARMSMRSAAEGNRFGREIDARHVRVEVLGNQRHRAPSTASHVQHAAAIQVALADQLEGQSDRARIEDTVRHLESCFILTAEREVAVVQEEGRVGDP